MLEDIRVVDCSTGIAGAYATKLFCDAGADVIKVEPPGGDPLRRWSASETDPGKRDGALFGFLNASKRSVTGVLGDPALADLIASADVFVESEDPGVAEAAGLLDQSGLVVLSITPWGRGGPLSGRPATEFIVQAECGSIANRGSPDGPPVQAGGRLAEWAAGSYGAPAALAAVGHARRTGSSVHLDIAMADVMCVCSGLYSDLMHSLAGRPRLRGKARMLETPSIEPTADGWVGFNTNSAQMFADFLILVGRPDLLDDKELASIPGRTARAQEWNAIIHTYTRTHTTAEVIAAASELRIPVAPVCNGATLLDHEQFVERDLFMLDPSGNFRVPRPPYKLSGARPAPRDPAPAPAPGQHTNMIEARERHAAHVAHPSHAGSLALEGLRVLDLTCWWAGPSTTQFLAALGADTIHVEAIQRLDGMRFAAAGGFLQRPQWWEYSAFFLTINTNKRGITLDLSQPEGLALAKRLVGWADVVVENYTPRVMERFGLDWPAVHASNPQAVMVRMPAFGLDGPWRDRPGFAQNMEQMSGLAWVTGFPDGPPLIPKGLCDPIGGMHAAFAILVALAERERRGEGLLVEVPLIESTLNVAAEQVIEYTAYEHVLERLGNRSPGLAPQGVYACRGNEQWLAISVANDEHWRALVAALGTPAWAKDPALDHYPGRRDAHDELDTHIGDWAAVQDRDAAAELLVGAGVPAATLADPRVISTHPQLSARGLAEPCEHPVVGVHPVIGMPLRWSGVERWIRTPAPTVGQHNETVLGEVLGLSSTEIEHLVEQQVIGTSPLGL